MASSTAFIHVLATRLGIGVYDPAWFDYRLRLFETITVPSVAAQTSPEFTWLLVVDRRMPPAARARVDRAVAGLPHAVVLPVEFKTDFRPTVVQWCQQRAEQVGAGYVLTSRLDDDDALRVDALERLQTEAAEFTRTGPHRYAVLSLNLGCMWVPAYRFGYTRYHDSIAIGLSLMEPVEECRSVYGKPHREIKQKYAPRGTYIRGMDGDTRWWLYAAHVLADSDQGDQARTERIRTHRYGYHLDDAMLATFGLDPAAVDRLAQISEPATTTATKFLSLRSLDLEREIKDLRLRLQDTPRSRLVRRHLVGRRIRELERARVDVGTGIVRGTREEEHR